MYKCNRAGCKNNAEFQIEVLIWALCMPTYDRHSGNCLRLMTGVLVCEEHKAQTKVDDVLTSEVKTRIVSAVSEVGRADPDFLNAELEWVELNAELEWINIKLPFGTGLA
jgi:hypothetical protein